MSNVVMYEEQINNGTAELKSCVADLMATSSAIVSPKDRIADIDSRRKSDERNRGYFLAEVTNTLVSMLKRMSESEKIKAYIPNEQIKHSKGVSIGEIEERFSLVSTIFFTCYETIFREDNKPKDMNPEYYGLRKYVERIDREPEFWFYYRRMKDFQKWYYRYIWEGAMKITVGGSFHEPGWTAVCETVKRLKDVGHEVLAPRRRMGTN